MKKRFVNSDSEEKYDKYFSDDKIKAECFDMIASFFYDRNFSSFSKCDMEVLMFHFYMERIIENSKNENGILNYSACSDYKIGKELGLTPQKVKNYKIKKELLYPNETYNWERSFADILSNADNINFEGDRVKILISDPNVHLALQDYIEEKGGTAEIHLNSKILDVKVEYLLDFAVMIEDDDSLKKSVENEIKKLDISHKIVKYSTIGRTVIESGVDIFNFPKNISSVLKKGNAAINLLLEYINKKGSKE